MKFKLNKKQKGTLYAGLTIVVFSFIVWLVYGGEIFTKTEILVEVEDELFGSYKEWQDKFIWGLDLSLIISGITIFLSLIIIYIQKNKKEQL